MERRDNQPGQTPEGEQKSTAFQHSLETTMANTASALAVMHIK